MIYGKLTDVGLMQAPNPLRHNGRLIYNPSGATCAAAGYLPVVEIPAPEEGYYTAHWEAQEGQIVQVWTAAEPSVPEPDVPTWQEITNNRISSLESAVDALIVAQLEVVSGNV